MRYFEFIFCTTLVLKKLLSVGILFLLAILQILFAGSIPKTFVPYFTADTVNLFGQDYPVGRRNKPCIGLAMHHAGGSAGEQYNQRLFSRVLL